MKRCQSCGRLTELLEDFASLDHSSIYCSSCADGSGKLKTFEEVLENLTQRIAKTDGFDEQASRNAALQILGRQPAWEPKFRREENVKKNLKSLVLICSAVVLVLSAGGFFWWLRGKYIKSMDKPYELHYGELSIPFENIKKHKTNGFEITEFLCNGDQVIEKLDNGIMQLGSIENPVVETNQNTSAIGGSETSEYLVNLDTGKSVNLTLINPNESKELGEIGIVVENKIKTVSWSTKQLWKSPSDSSQGVHWPTINTNVQCQYDIDLKMLINSQQTSKGDVIYAFEGKSFTCIPGCNNEDTLGTEKQRFLCITEKQSGEDRIVASMEVANCEVTPWWGIDGKGIIGITPENQDERYLVIADMKRNTFSQMKLPSAIQSEFPFTSRDMQDENIWYCEKYNEKRNMRDLYVYNFKTNLCKLFASYPEYLNFQSMAHTNNSQMAILKGYDWKGEIDISIGNYWSIENGSTAPRQLIETKYTKYQGVLGHYIVLLEYTDFNNDRISKEQADDKASKLAKLVLVDIGTGKKTLLDDRVYGINVKIENNIVAWTTYKGPKDDQWKNVCFTKLP